MADEQPSPPRLERDVFTWILPADRSNELERAKCNLLEIDGQDSGRLAIIRRNPLVAAGISFLAGFALGKNSSRPVVAMDHPAARGRLVALARLGAAWGARRALTGLFRGLL